MSRVLLFGATGLIGGELLSLLLADPDISAVTIAGRSHPDVEHDKLTRCTVSLDALADHAGLFDVDVVFCCLGTTLRKAGSRKAFRQVDYRFVVAVAQQSRLADVPRVLLVSAVNANPRGVSFYARVKGQMEQDVSALGLRSLVFMQPSLLEGHRQEQRTGEQLGQVAMAMVKPILGWSKASWLSVDARAVAAAMLMASKQSQAESVTRLRYAEITALAAHYTKTREGR